MTTSNNPQPPQPGPVAQQLTKLQSNGHQTPSNGQQLPTGQPAKKTSNWIGFSGRTLWDWVQFFAVLALPIIIAAGTLYYTQQITLQQTQASERQHQTDIQIALDQQQTAILQTYLDNMSNMLLNQKLRGSKPGDEVRGVARARTLTALRLLNSVRKGIILQFLEESSLIYNTLLIGNKINVNDPIIDLSGADLSTVDLSEAKEFGATNPTETEGAGGGAELSGANLMLVNLDNANLSRVWLIDTWLMEASLKKANLSRAVLTRANLSGTDLNVWCELGSPKALPIQQGSESQQRPFQLMIEPQTKVM